GDWALWSLAVILGFSYWATLPLTSALTAELYGLKHLGMLNGVTFTGHQIGSSLGIQLGGLLRDLTGSYALPFAIATLLLFAASLVRFGIQEKRYSVRYQTRPEPRCPMPVRSHVAARGAWGAEVHACGSPA